MNNTTMRLLTQMRQLPSDGLVTLSGGLGRPNIPEPDLAWTLTITTPR